jgi:hypothetical protein
VQKLATDMKQPFIVTERDLHQYLFEEGFLITTDKNKKRGTLTIRPKLQGAQRPVLHLSFTVLTGSDDEEAEA